MTVYAVFEVEVHDIGSDAYAAYRAAVPALIERFGGRFRAAAASVSDAEAAQIQ